MKKFISIPGHTCPVSRTVEIVGDKWTSLILRDLLLQGPRRFQDFIESLVGISPNILSNRLKKLQEYEIIESQLYSQHPPRNDYRLTERGKDLGVIIGGMRDWGNKHTKS
ncbi:winged helix-turn-helix transcriptional regulator [Leptospira sp. GIMC2001]|uniref:winged helix-turn-helix transcriptional regulator n=1 Tax=Leptospira sp. GIMC2001 TaxID=1513297 RepID=UPI00234B5948|nr:helix-turn-helix domain-containing protein [Leptospira sp. GIMC2001]WCL49614.1 helix-turn-helix domain-containing protein [Leptospira sp. GIMC2001]